ncbi:MacB family efflux pump subunit [Cupriavidus sp.]|uniref:MacB family efflux pump subunit n=1 Tax=Cupriavidus sp. TaxID=1873897 RepID=UPI003D0D730A
MTQAPLLLLQHVERSYRAGDQDVPVLRQISLAICAGEMVAIVGASGSGKSTLMHILGCLDQASAGRYLVAGQDVAALDDDALARLRRERFGFIFQRYHLLARLSAADNVEVPAIYAASGRAGRRARAVRLLARIGLGDRAGHRPAQLSGGQQQRVSIARALMNGGQVILADEPTGALDSHSGQEVLAILRELHALGHTVIIVTHDMALARNAGRIIEIADGRIVADRANRPAPAAAAGQVNAPPSPVPGQVANGGGDAPPRRARAWHGFTEAFAMAWGALMAHRMRTALTMLGIIIGIASVVSIVAIGEGAKRYVMNDIRAIGANTLEIFPGADFGDDRAAGIRTLVESDIDALHALSYVDSATPVTSKVQRLRHRNADVNASVHGVGASFFRVRGLGMTQGAPFRPDEVRQHAQVVVIDEKTRRKLFGDVTPVLGKIVLVGSLPCVVIGVAREKKSMFDDNGSSLNIWLPYTTAGSRLFGRAHFDEVSVRIREGQPSAAAQHGIERVLTQRHGKKDFFTYNMDSIVKTVERTGQALTLFLSAVAVISLLVGGIGVMNIMLVSVTERTREIGIRMAVGARQRDVLLQFLTEAVLVCMVGGAIGTLLAYLIGLVLALLMPQWRMVFSTSAVAGAFVCSSLIGVVFGYMPARNAARLQPIEALGHE